MEKNRFSLKQIIKGFSATLCLLAFGLTSCAGYLGTFDENQERPQQFKVVQYNIWNGFRNPQADETQEDHDFSQKEGVRFLKEQQADVVALMEFRFFSMKEFESMAKEWGHDYYTRLKADGYPVAITSKYPIKVIEKVLNGCGHGYLHVKTAGVHVFATHLSPGLGISSNGVNYEKKRTAEATKIMLAVTPLLRAGESVILTGDLNAESILDTAWFAPNSPSRQSFPTMDVFYNGGLKDSYVERRPAHEYKNTCSTQSEEADQTRIDYILLSENLMESCATAGVYNDQDDPALKRVSDHYPIYATWN